MSKYFQLDFFKEPEICRLEHKLEEAKKSSDKVRRSLFARISDLEKRYNDLYYEHEAFKWALCHGEGFYKEEKRKNG